MTRMKSCCLWVRGKTTMKSILTSFNFQVGYQYLDLDLSVHHTRLWNVGNLGILTQSSLCSFFILFDQQISRKSRYILIAPGWMEYWDPWAFSTIVSLRPPKSSTHNLLWCLSTPYYPQERVFIYFFRTNSFNISRWGQDVVQTSYEQQLISENYDGSWHPLWGNILVRHPTGLAYENKEITRFSLPRHVTHYP